MRDIYLGDSYDLVKRFWCDALRSVAPLYAHPRFIPAAIRPPFNAVTTIPILDPDQRPTGPYGLLLDPHTGIPLPAESPTEATASHAPLPFIVQANEHLDPTYMICFDQSYHRRHDLTREGQRSSKMSFLHQRGISSFYYVSHAPFLFMAAKSENLVAVRQRLLSLGIPSTRFEPAAEAEA